MGKASVGNYYFFFFFSEGRKSICFLFVFRFVFIFFLFVFLLLFFRPSTPFDRNEETGKGNSPNPEALYFQFIFHSVRGLFFSSFLSILWVRRIVRPYHWRFYPSMARSLYSFNLAFLFILKYSEITQIESSLYFSLCGSILWTCAVNIAIIWSPHVIFITNLYKYPTTQPNYHFTFTFNSL